MTLTAVHNIRPKLYTFPGVRMKILLASADTGGQFSLIEGTMCDVLHRRGARR